MFRVLTLTAAALLAAASAPAQLLCGDVNADGAVNTADALAIARGEPLKCAPATPARFQLVGFTTATSTGDRGVLGFTSACQTEFPASRMCSSVEIMETSVLVSGLAGDAWVRPSFRPLAVGSGTLVIDASGAIGAPNGLSCQGWTGTLGFGLKVDASGGFAASFCSEQRPVACCAPVP
jgi:hypothetical protein